MLLRYHVDLGSGKTPFNTWVFNFVVEGTKLGVCLVMLHNTGEDFRFEISNSFKYAVPAALWGFTNNIAFYQYVLDPAAVTVLQNMKIPVTAILLKFLVKKVYTSNQWWAVLFLAIGCIQSQYPCGGARADSISHETQLVGFIAVATLVLVNSFVAAYMELLLKDTDLSFWRTSQFLYMYGMAWNFGGIILPPMLGASSNPFDVFSVFDGLGTWFFSRLCCRL